MTNRGQSRPLLQFLLLIGTTHTEYRSLLIYAGGKVVQVWCYNAIESKDLLRSRRVSR